MFLLYAFLVLLGLGILFAAVVSIADKVPEILLELFARRLKKRSPGELVELAMRIDKDRAYADAIAAQISDSDALLRIGLEAQSASMRSAAHARHCLLFGHQFDDKCVCGVCKQEVHDFRNEQGKIPAETSVYGEFACTRCSAVFCREYVPGCKDTCSFMECCDGDGEIPRYSSLSGEGGCWYETCERYVPSCIRETVRSQQ